MQQLSECLNSDYFNYNLPSKTVPAVETGCFLLFLSPTLCHLLFNTYRVPPLKWLCLTDEQSTATSPQEHCYTITGGDTSPQRFQGRKKDCLKKQLILKEKKRKEKKRELHKTRVQMSSVSTQFTNKWKKGILLGYTLSWAEALTKHTMSGDAHSGRNYLSYLVGF